MSDLVPVEWAATHVGHPIPYAMIRRLRLGPNRDLYYRVTTWAQDPTARKLIGYWGTLEEAEHNAGAYIDACGPIQWRAIAGGTFRKPRDLTPQKPPPPRADSR